MNEVRKKILETRTRDIISLAYNINKMNFLVKLEDKYSYSSNNKIRVMNHILSNNFVSGIYVTKSFITENNLRLKENSFGFLYEYLIDKDIELGTKEYKYIYKYNIEQLVDEDKEKALSLIELPENTKKFNLKKDNIEKFIKEKQIDKIEKILFYGIIKLVTGKNVFVEEKYDKEAKQTLIELIEEDINIFKNWFYNADNLAKIYLTENEIQEFTF